MRKSIVWWFRFEANLFKEFHELDKNPGLKGSPTKCSLNQPNLKSWYFDPYPSQNVPHIKCREFDIKDYTSYGLAAKNVSFTLYIGHGFYPLLQLITNVWSLLKK